MRNRTGYAQTENGDPCHQRLVFAWFVQLIRGDLRRELSPDSSGPRVTRRLLFSSVTAS